MTPTAAPQPGPVESTITEGAWHGTPSQINRAIVLDLAGATPEDVNEGWAALDSARRPVHSEWDYFTAVIGNRIAARVIAARELHDQPGS